MNSHVSLLPASTPRSAFGKLLGAEAISAIARTQNAAQDIGQLLVWPTLFFAGLLFPRWALPAVLRDIGDWTPLAPPCTRCRFHARHLPVRATAARAGRLGGGVRVPGRALLPVGVAEAACGLHPGYLDQGPWPVPVTCPSAGREGMAVNEGYVCVVDELHRGPVMAGPSGCGGAGRPSAGEPAPLKPRVRRARLHARARRSRRHAAGQQPR